MAMTGGTVGKTYLVNNLNEKMYVNQRVATIRIIKTVNIDYIYSILESNYIKNIIHQNKNSTNDNISMKTINSFLIPLPPSNEQKNIVKKLYDITPFIEKYDILESCLEELNMNFPMKIKNSILQDAVQGKLVSQDPDDEPAIVLLEKIREEKERLIKEKKIKRNKNESFIFKENNHFYEKIGKKGEAVCIDDEIPFDIPDSWEWCRMENIIQLISGRDMKASEYNNKKKGIPYITGASNMEEGNLIINRWIENPNVISIKNDILLTCKGTIGKLLVLNEPKAHIARQIMAIRIFDDNLIYRNFVLAVLEFYVNKLQNIAKSMIPGISREDVLMILVPLPPFYEQKRIIKKIEEINEINF